MSAVENPTPTRRPLPRRLLPVVAVLGCLAAGVSAGAFLIPKPTTNELVADTNVKLGDPKADAKPAAPPAPEQPRNLPEEAIRGQQFDKALKLLPAAKPGDPAADRVAFLRGLALEGAGRFGEAFSAYRLAADPDRDPALWAAASLGAARAAMGSGDTNAARLWLARVELRSGHPACQATHAAEECRLLRARLDVAKLPAPPDPDPLDDRVPAVPPFELSGAYLDWLTEGWGRPPEDSPDAPNPATLPNGLHVNVANAVARVSGQLPDTRVTDVLADLARAAGWKFRLPPDLAPSLSGTSVAVALNNHLAADVLTALTEPFGLRWQLGGDLLTIRNADPAAEPDPVPTAVASLARAADTDHPHAHAATVRLGALLEKQGHTAAATARYTRLLTDAPLAAEAAHAGYNLALLHLRTGNPTAARLALREVIDRGGKDKWADLGRWWTGRAYLDDCDPAAAFKPLRAALAGKDRATRSAAALGLVLCHLLQGNEVAAHETLERQVFASDDPHAALVDLFGEHLRHATAPTRGRAETLLAAVKAADGGRRLGPAGAYLVGRAYRDLGFTARAAALYEKAIAAGGPWSPRLTFTVGELLADDDQFDAARTRFLAVAAVDAGEFGRKAELRLADLDLKSGRPDDALARCRKLFDRADADETALLLLMGRAHEMAGEPLKAAACFAGRRPPD